MVIFACAAPTETDAAENEKRENMEIRNDLVQAPRYFPVSLGVII